MVLFRLRGCDHVYPITRCSGGDGVTCREPTPPRLWRTSHLWVWIGEHRCHRVKAIGSKTAARQAERLLHTTIKTTTGRESRYYEARDATSPTQPSRAPFEAEQRNHPRRHHLPDRIMSRRDRDARFRSGYLGPVGDAGSTVTPPQF
nr:MAG TPA: hypothetical protein [Caudoviricetes sp.]